MGCGIGFNVGQLVRLGLQFLTVAAADQKVEQQVVNIEPVGLQPQNFVEVGRRLIALAVGHIGARALL